MSFLKSDVWNRRPFRAAVVPVMCGLLFAASLASIGAVKPDAGEVLIEYARHIHFVRDAAATDLRDLDFPAGSVLSKQRRGQEQRTRGHTPRADRGGFQKVAA